VSAFVFITSAIVFIKSSERIITFAIVFIVSAKRIITTTLKMTFSNQNKGQSIAAVSRNGEAQDLFRINAV
jgi:hypothetical protein